MYGDFVTLAARSAASQQADRYGLFVQAASFGRRVRFGQIPGAGVLDPYWWDYVSLSDLEYLDSRVEHLNTDVVSYRLPPAPNPVTEPDAYVAWSERDAWLRGFRWDWSSFYTLWNQWLGELAGNPLRRMGTDAQAKYDEYRSQYNELLRRFKERVGTKATSASKAESEQKREAEGGEDVTGAIKFASVAVIAIAAVWLVTKMKE